MNLITSTSNMNSTTSTLKSPCLHLLRRYLFKLPFRFAGVLSARITVQLKIHSALREGQSRHHSQLWLRTQELRIDVRCTTLQNASLSTSHQHVRGNIV